MPPTAPPEDDVSNAADGTPRRISGLSGRHALSKRERVALSKMARKLKPPASRLAGLADKLVKVAITYRLMRQQDTGRGGGKAWAPQGLTIADQRRELKRLGKSLARVSENILSLDTPLLELLDHAYHSEPTDVDFPNRPHNPTPYLGEFEDDQHTLVRELDRMAVWTNIALYQLLPPVGGRPPLKSLRWAVGKLKSAYTGIKDSKFSVGGERGDVGTLNAPAYWVVRVVKIIDPTVTDANIKTAFR